MIPSLAVQVGSFRVLYITTAGFSVVLRKRELLPSAAAQCQKVKDKDKTDRHLSRYLYLPPQGCLTMTSVSILVLLVRS